MSPNWYAVPIFKFFDVKLFSVLQEGADGSLTDKIVSKGLSNLGKAADGNQLVYLDLSLPVSS